MADGSEREIELKIDAGLEKVLIIRVNASESLSQHFHITLDVRSKLGEVNWLPHLGKPAVITVKEDGELLRHFHGIVVDAYFTEYIEEYGFVYRLTLRPKAFLHEQGRSFRIFQGQKVRAILEDMLKRCGITSEFGKLEGGNRTRSYCVQYGESDFGFVCRLMEEEGIYYFYRHDDNDHVMVLCSSPTAHKDGAASPLTHNPDSASIHNPDSAHRGAHGKFVQTWHERVTTGAEAKVTMRDYDFTRSGTVREVNSAATDIDHPEDAIEIYNYPGRFYVDADGTELAKTLLEARRANRRTFTGDSKNGAIACGTTFKLEHPTMARYDGKYLLTHVTHSIGAEQHRSGGEAHDGTEVSFEAIPADTPWHAPLTTRRPVVAGPETAIVTGPESETKDGINGIHVDEYGRVRLQFHWDRDGKLDENSSCWVRVSQTGHLGNMILPRVGSEVLVDFINGDPDRPIVVGRVYNSGYKPIYALPEHKAKAVWRTKRYKETKEKYTNAKALDIAPTGANEIRLDDKGGEEELFMYAEKQMTTRVRLDETHHVGRDQILKVGYDRTKIVENNEKVEITKNRDVKIDETDKLIIKSKLTTEVTNGDEERKISANQKIDVGKTIKIEAGTEIQIIVGSSKITLSQSGVKIEGTQLEFAGTAQAKMTAPMTTTDGSATMIVTGGIVKIN